MKQYLMALMVFLFGTSVYAAYFPVRDNSNTDIIVVLDSEDDLFIKHQLISKAKYSIEMISHLQTMGPVGGLIVDDIRKAMGRGVKVKYLFEAVATMTGGGEFGLDSIPFLTESKLYKKSGSQLIVNRVSQRWSSPFAMNDLVHKKVLIVDRGTPNETIVVTGRNNHEANFTWSDLTFVIRRVNSNLPYLGDDLVSDFDKSWDFISKYFKVEEPTVLDSSEIAKYAKYKFRPVNPTKEGIETDRLLSLEPRSGDTLASNQFRPASVRIITTDTLEQIASLKLPKTIGLRPQIVDDISNYLRGALKSAIKVEANIYALIIPQPLLASLGEFVKRNGELTILTNSSESLRSALPISTVTDAIEYYAKEALEELDSKASSLNTGDRVKMYSFDPKKTSKNPPALSATHRKLWVLEFANGQKLSLFGSHNLTTASSSKSDEIMIAAFDVRMGNYFSAIHKQEISTNYKRVSLKEAKDKNTVTKVTRQMGNQLFQSIY
ncbi:MAG: phosphatidylserine/phosphatidylglycerophosphate/cardiolipin synthase family protein [Bdellovibrionaceae bacterium]|nr:phosphatidylserine/phosphatidylglycerophosphate/cardiolipin synthase family protein [Pseudobdellovibrionaceae bacterium]